MLRIPVSSGILYKSPWIRYKSSSSSIRSTFIQYFVENHGHRHVRSSSVVPLYDSTVPFVNAGMNQFKGVFLGTLDAPCPRAVNSQKCIRVGGKHNDLDVVGTDCTHHTFFEMLGNWSFGDYYKKEACQMAWDLLLGPYRLKPENLVVTYFAGNAVIGLEEDRECRDIWKAIGVPSSRLKPLGAKDNFWEMGQTGPCGPCTEIHHVNSDGTLTEIWNLVFIQCNREENGKVSPLARMHVDTGMGLERMAALLQGVPSNYDTDLFRPLIQGIQRYSKGVDPYKGIYSPQAVLDTAYRRVSDHARMIAVCLADGVFPAASLNLKQIMRKSFKISADVFQNPNLVSQLYSEVVNTLGEAYPELQHKEKDAKLIIEQEQQSYAKLRSQLAKRWKDLVTTHPEVDSLGDVEISGFAQGYAEFKQTMAKQKTTVIPGEVVFKLYDTHGFPDDVITRIAHINNLSIDKEGFTRLLTQHKSRHKTALKEQTSNRGQLFNKAIDKLTEENTKHTNDQHKYAYTTIDNNLKFEPLKTKVLAILDDDGEWLDFSDPSENRTYYIVTQDTNFYCEEGGQVADTGVMSFERANFKVDSVFKIRDFVFHKGSFLLNKCSDNNYVKRGSDVMLTIDSEKRLNVMRNHTAAHLLNAAIRKVLPNSVVCQIGSAVTDKRLSLNLAVYGEKLSQQAIMDAQDLIRESIKADVPVTTTVIDSTQVPHAVLTVPGETYPEKGLRLVEIPAPLASKELCCGSHAPRTGLLGQVCVTTVKGAGGHTPTIHALTGDRALEAQELFCRAQKLEEVVHLMEPTRCATEVSAVRSALSGLCGTGGAPHGDYRACVALLDTLVKSSAGAREVELLQSVADTEISEALSRAAAANRPYIVHFLRCSYLMEPESAAATLRAARPAACAALLACAGGVIVAACAVPQEYVSGSWSAGAWLEAVAGAFGARPLPAAGRCTLHYAEMTPTKVSLINCEQLVQEAIRRATQYAEQHATVHKTPPSQSLHN